MKRCFTNKLRALVSNKKGSEVVEKILMIIVSLAIAAAAATFVVTTINNAMDKGNGIAGGVTPATPEDATNPLAPASGA